MEELTSCKWNRCNRWHHLRSTYWSFLYPLKTLWNKSIKT